MALRVEGGEPLDELLGAGVEHQGLAAVVVGLAGMLCDERREHTVHRHLVKRERHLVAFSPRGVHEGERGGDLLLDERSLLLMGAKARVVVGGEVFQGGGVSAQQGSPGA